jgi:hypothetical protein
VTKEPVQDGYGENTLVWLLQGTNDSTRLQRPVSDETYSVTVANVILNGSAQVFSYTVTVFDPDTLSLGAPQTAVIAPTAASANSPFSVSVTSMAGASGYQVALYRLVGYGGVITPAVTPNPWSYVTGPAGTYNPVESTAFHLYHADLTNQSLVLNKKLLVGQGASLAFDSWFTFALPGQVAHVYLSLDDGLSWQDVFTEVGASNTQHTTKTIDLTPYAGRFVRLKFEFAYLPGQAAYNQAPTGWYFNNIKLTNVDEMLDGSSATVAAAQTNTTLTASVQGNYVLLGRTEYQGMYFSDWGPITRFQVGSSISRLLNIATRGQVQTGDNVMIAGFIIQGSTPKKLLIRARGPSLAAAPFNVPGTLANPFLTLYSGATPIDSNDDFASHPNAASIPVDWVPTNPKESAIVATLNPGAYTAIVNGVGGTSGIAIVEVFEIDHPETPIINIATRGPVNTGDNVMIAGLIIQGDAPKTVLITARGPSMAVPPFNVPGTLPDPTLTLYSGQTVIASNDNWGSAANAVQIQSAVGAPTNPKESAILITLQPGAYTAIVSGANGVTGLGIVEVFAQ